MTVGGSATEPEQRGHASDRQAMTIRSHLLLLALSAFLPVLAFALFASALLVRHDRATQQEGAVDRARAMMTAVDTELRSSITTLQALAASRALAHDDPVGFRETATRVLQTQPAWLDIVLSLPSGDPIVDLAVPAPPASGPAEDPGSVRRVAQSLAPAIGDVAASRPLGVPVVPVRVPVVRGALAAYVLTALVSPESFRDLIVQQHLPQGWVSGIVDGRLRFVARVPPQPAGSPSSEGFRAAVARAGEGWYRGRTVEGADTFTAHKTSRFSGWSIGVAIPTATVDAAAQRSQWLMAAGALLSIGLAIGATLVIGRRIAGPIRSLALAARSVGSGRTLVVESPERVREVSEVAVALRDAAASVGERQRLLEREKEVLQAADVAKNEFLAMLSHELRNPLAAMTSAAHLLKVVDAGHPAAAQARNVIERQTRHMTRLIEDLLDVTRITMGKATLERRPFDLAEAVATIVESWRSSGRLRGHALELRKSSVFVDGDRSRVDQIVSNLLDNAVKFTPIGGRISVEVAREGDAAVLIVADQGDGIAPGLIGRVFDLFVQGEHGMDRGKGGMGIGLALVRRLAEMHGGTASVSSAGPGKGSTFTVRLPAVARAGDERRVPVTPAPGARRILIIEDNDDAREMLREALALSGHDVQGARDGASGIALATENQFEVALIDIGLPDIDGYEVARRLRSSSGGRITLIALSGYGQPEDRRHAAEAGFDAHLTKPVDTERLQAAIGALGGR